MLLQLVLNRLVETNIPLGHKLFYCPNSYSFPSACSSSSSAVVCCSCSALESPGCSAASKSAHSLRWSAPSDPSSWPGRVVPATDPRRRWPSAPHPSSSSSPAITSTTWTWPPRRAIPQRSMSYKSGHCDSSQNELFPPFFSVCLSNRCAISSLNHSVWVPLQCWLKLFYLRVHRLFIS